MRKLVVAGLAVVASVVFVPSAYAGDSSAACTTEGQCSGHAAFDHNGDHLYAADTDSDGYGVYVKYYRADVDTWGEFTNRKGSGTTVDHNMNMREGSKIRYRVCRLSSSGGTINCSGWTYGTA
ncbi:hypothetical protein GCM10009854_44110 [Saccharopolyspora halophila]|uniref:Secreted protein n=1 Tax=Saccharopolyspora halophila TaxID=405551 RepID=A0ABP5TS29_9PSEU